eukprot:m.1234710 g.1234710  ORF g.1234710 m.1234710 type:complete len:56 (-) comp24665_c0_seq38:2181-2348(-)
MSDALVAAQLQVLGTWYGRRQQQKRKQARFDLEQTELYACVHGGVRMRTNDASVC